MLKQKRLENQAEESKTEEDEEPGVSVDDVLKPLAMSADKYASVNSISAISVSSLDNLGVCMFLLWCSSIGLAWFDLKGGS